MSLRKIALLITLFAAIGGSIAWYFISQAEFDIYVPMFAEHCGGCHGTELTGTADGPALIGRNLLHGDSVADLTASISNVHASLPHITSKLTAVDIKGLAMFIGERRMGQTFLNFNFDREINLPTDLVASEAHTFKVETFVDGLDPLIFSIEPLPDGTMLVSEKSRGLSVISADGVQGPVIEGTPETGGAVDIRGIQWGTGWLLDVATHPEYETNGWIYLHYTDRCTDACDDWIATSMNRLDRGRIVDGQWVDVETIWHAPRSFYVATPDTGAGGRITFDESGHVYISVGIKSPDEGDRDTTPQDLAKPYGKIHRVRDDGRIPADNPFAAAANVPFSVRSIWTYGHRSPQGLEWNPWRKAVWNSEMGPRGGDEINELIAGRNYGWPFHSNGLEYTGHEVARHLGKAVEFDANDAEHTLVDITPSPAIGSFVFYDGEVFSDWYGNVLIGSLKGSSLYRMVFDGKTFIKQETLLDDVARIRDVEVGYDGFVYVLLENKSGSRIIRLIPDRVPA